MEEVQNDEFGIEMTVKCRKPAPLSAYAKEDVFVPPVLAKWLRPHQREGVQFMYECVMGLKDYNGNGCILADDMGLVSYDILFYRALEAISNRAFAHEILIAGALW